MFCSQCGYKMPDTAKFCTNCGAKLTGLGTGSAPVQPPYSAPAAPACAAPAAAAASKKKKKHILLKILLILLALFLACVLGLVAMFPLYSCSRINVDIEALPADDPELRAFTETMQDSRLLVDDSGSTVLYSFLSLKSGVGYEEKTERELDEEAGPGVTVSIDTAPGYVYYSFEDPQSNDYIMVTFRKATLGEKLRFLKLYLD